MQSAEGLAEPHLDPAQRSRYTAAMSQLESIEAEVRALPPEQARQFQLWLASYLEDHTELRLEFVASIERGMADSREDRVRLSKSDEP
jgi:hypothetical protein